VERQDALTLARRIVRLVASSDLRMGLVTGSAARDLADDRSDLDVYLYWDAVDVAALSAPQRFDAIGARPAFGIPTATGWFTKLEHDGRYIDVESVDVAVLSRAAEALGGSAAPVDWAVRLAAGLRDAVAVNGQRDLAAWQDRLAYRDETAAAEVAARAPTLLAPTALFELTYARGDVLSFTARLSRLLLDVVALLGAVNRRFIPVDDPKWIPWHLAQLPHRPPDMEGRLRDGLTAPSPATMADLDGLVAATLDLVDEHVANADTRAARFALRLRPRPG
jgi:hypothetical protein